MTEDEFDKIAIYQIDTLVAHYLGEIEIEDIQLFSLARYNNTPFRRFTAITNIGYLLMGLVETKHHAYILRYDHVLKSYLFGFNEDRLYVDDLLPYAICKAICCEFY
jgi:hypothetical protein